MQFFATVMLLPHFFLIVGVWRQIAVCFTWIAFYTQPALLLLRSAVDDNDAFIYLAHILRQHSLWKCFFLMGFYKGLQWQNPTNVEQFIIYHTTRTLLSAAVAINSQSVA